MTKFSLPEARRIALTAQGFLDPQPERVTRRHIHRVMDRVGVVQVDSVNVLARAHYLPFFSRLGGYDTTLLDDMRDERPWPLVESWAHMASLIPSSRWPLFEFRQAKAKPETWGRLGEVLRQHPDIIDTILAEYDQRGPLTSRECEAGLNIKETKRRDQWGWNWNSTKLTIEYLFRAGVLAPTGRNKQFERVFDLVERVIPDEAYAQLGTIPFTEAYIELVRTAAKALGVATRASLRDYFRMTAQETDPAIKYLLGTGELESVEVADHGEHFLWTAARRPRKAEVVTLVSPFDSLIWHRERTQQLFGMHYRIGIYTPKAQRTHGYYVLPFVFGDELVGRVDLKADRAAGTLRVQQLTWEPNAPRTAPSALDQTLKTMADWLGLSSVTFSS
ncbi:winged helix-turn-helix domain-containing protein [Corynebacterium freiburgense]|uniref:winged helix-turn-helix domain-containing protein n=1 Tax=Corynebacterium freiburgense TaxID=556548 RepID=UPI001969E8C8|nr:crosslink repair DNA glycosylase YcaQ family protein [Corynebacterium freiburgense]WJZ02737.1 hypothetical protein CFREI_07260 [Corynebacterium freiburgense]